MLFMRGCTSLQHQENRRLGLVKLGNLSTLTFGIQSYLKFAFYVNIFARVCHKIP